MKTLVVHGLEVPVSSDDVSPVIWKALQSGSYEGKEARWALRAARPDDRILELGAGIGVITSLLAGVPGAHVWAFEANPRAVTIARRVLAANRRPNVTLAEGIAAAGPPRDFVFYLRRDFWMSSLVEHQGDYETTMTIQSFDIDHFIAAQKIDLLVMDIEGGEHDLLTKAELPGVERLFLELHDHLYALAGIRDIMEALAAKGFGYDPRGSCGACVLFSRKLDEQREYHEEGEQSVA